MTSDYPDYPTEPQRAVTDSADGGSAESAAAQSTPRGTSARSINVPTLLASAGVSAVVAAIILSIGVVALSASPRTTTPTAIPTVINLGAAQSNNPSPGPISTPPPGETSTPPLTAAPTVDLGYPTQVELPTTTTTTADTAAPQTPTTTTNPATATATATTLPANFRVTTDHPTLQDFNNIVTFLVETPASDTAKAANVEGGMRAVIVPKTVYTLGLFRAPLGWNNVTGPLTQQGNRATATLNSGSAGRPTIRMTIEFKKIDGSWRLSANSLCHGVKTVGLNIYCNA